MATVNKSLSRRFSKVLKQPRLNDDPTSPTVCPLLRYVLLPPLFPFKQEDNNKNSLAQKDLPASQGLLDTFRENVSDLLPSI